MSTKRTQFFDGFNSETTPNTVVVSASGLIGSWQGTWTAQNYVANDAVYFNGSTYLCILDTVSNEDPTNNTYWELAALKGESVDIDEGAISFDEAKVSTIEALPGITPEDRYMITVLTDDRSNQALPAEISGDMTLNLLVWDGTTWSNFGQFIGPEGPVGPQGPIGNDAAGIWSREVPAGTIDGVNDTFTLANTPTTDQHLSIFLDGNFLQDTEYSIVTNTITINTPPALGQSLFAHYGHSGTPVSAPGTENLEYHTVTAGEETAKAFTLSTTPSDGTKVLVDIIGGTSQHYGIDFTIAGGSFSWGGFSLDGILLENDVVRLKYFS